GELKGYEYAGDSGGRLEINFCPNCGSPVLLNILSKPDIVSIKVGSFDDTSWFNPTLSIWGDSAQAWMPEIPDCQVFGSNSR
ncbi:MAG: GFA family protein, partial [Rhodospirillaceae bacterium]|nr:GFA family protein [Rhodospirillaceae bacterium]